MFRFQTMFCMISHKTVLPLPIRQNLATENKTGFNSARYWMTKKIIFEIINDWILLKTYFLLIPLLTREVSGAKMKNMKHMDFTMEEIMWCHVCIWLSYCTKTHIFLTVQWNDYNVVIYTPKVITQPSMTASVPSTDLSCFTMMLSSINSFGWDIELNEAHEIKKTLYIRKEAGLVEKNLLQ